MDSFYLFLFEKRQWLQTIYCITVTREEERCLAVNDAWTYSITDGKFLTKGKHMGQEVLNVHSGIPWHRRYPSGVMLYPLIAEVSVVSFPLRCLSKQRFESTEFSPAQIYGSRDWSLRSSTHPLFGCTLFTCLCLFFSGKEISHPSFFRITNQRQSLQLFPGRTLIPTLIK